MTVFKNSFSDIRPRSFGIGILVFMYNLKGEWVLGDTRLNKVPVDSPNEVTDGVNGTNGFDYPPIPAPIQDSKNRPQTFLKYDTKLYALVHQALTESPLIDG